MVLQLGRVGKLQKRKIKDLLVVILLVGDCQETTPLLSN